MVLKAFSGDGMSARAARSEPRLLRRLHAETSLPVPEVVDSVDDHPNLSTPFFPAEREQAEAREDPDVATGPADAPLVVE